MNFGVDFSKKKPTQDKPSGLPQFCTQKYCHVYSPNHPICQGCPIYHKEPSEQICIPSHLNVSCQKADVCKSVSKRRRGFVCGSGFSHDDRMQSCAEYCRLCRGVGHGERGGHPI